MMQEHVLVLAVGVVLWLLFREGETKQTKGYLCDSHYQVKPCRTCNWLKGEG